MVGWCLHPLFVQIIPILLTPFSRRPPRVSGEVNKEVVVEMKADKANEEAGLLNKRPSTQQVRPTGLRGGGGVHECNS